MSRMPSCMVIWRSGYIRSNIWGMLLRGKIKFVISRRQYIGSNRVCEHGLRSLASPSLTFVFIVVTQTTVFVWHTKSGLVILTVYVDDILLIGSNSTGLVETKEYLRGYLWPRTWVSLNIFWELRLHLKNIVYFSFNGRRPGWPIATTKIPVDRKLKGNFFESGDFIVGRRGDR